MDPLGKLKDQAAQIENEDLRRQMLAEIEREATLLSNYSIFVQMAWYCYTKFLLAGELRDGRIVAIVLVLQSGSRPLVVNGVIHGTFLIHILIPPVEMETELTRLAGTLDNEVKQGKLPGFVYGFITVPHHADEVVREIAAGHTPPGWEIIYDAMPQPPGQGGSDADHRRAN